MSSQDKVVMSNNNTTFIDLTSPKPPPLVSKPPTKLTFWKEKVPPKSKPSSSTTNKRLVFRRTISAPQKSLPQNYACSVPQKKQQCFGMSSLATGDFSLTVAASSSTTNEKLVFHHTISVPQKSLAEYYGCSVPQKKRRCIVCGNTDSSSTAESSSFLSACIVSPDPQPLSIILRSRAAPAASSSQTSTDNEQALLPTKVSSYSDRELDVAGSDNDGRHPPSMRYVCHRCRESVSESKVAFCSARHACCSSCIEREVTKFLALARKGLLGCLVPYCKQHYTTHALQGLLPPLVIAIFEQKEAMEAAKSQKVLEQKNDTFKSADADGKQVDKVFSVPSHWQHMNDKLEYRLFNVDKSTLEYSAITDLFHHSMWRPRAQVKRIRRVQNRNLWHFYCMKKMQMEKAHKTTEGLEKQLFHGTTRDLLEAICSNNFDWRIGGSNGLTYGQGSYFARDASLSHEFTDCNPHVTRADECGPLWPIPKPHLHMMFVARVLHGHYVVGKPSYNKPPPRDKFGKCWDSCVNRKHDPTTYVIFDQSQCYPEYVIDYSNKLRDEF